MARGRLNDMEPIEPIEPAPGADEDEAPDAEHPRRPVRALVSSVSAQTGAMMPAFLTGALALQLRRDLGMSDSLLGAAVAFFFLVAAVASPHAGALTDHLGPQRSQRIANALVIASLLGSAVLVYNYVTLLLLLGVGAAGLAIAGPGTKVMVAKGVPLNRHGVAFGIQAGAVPLASLLAGLTIPTIALPFGWRWAYVVACALPILSFVIAPSVGAAVRVAQRAGRRLADIDYRPLIMLALAAAFGSAAATTLAAFFVSAAEETGISEGLAGALLSIGSALVVAGRIYAGLNADRRGTDPLRSVAALMAFSRSAGSQAPDFGVRIVGVNPGYTATDRAESVLRQIAENKLGSAERWRDVERELNLPFGRMGKPSEVADVVTFLVSPRASYVSGTIVTVDAGAANRNG